MDRCWRKRAVYYVVNTYIHHTRTQVLFIVLCKKTPFSVDQPPRHWGSTRAEGLQLLHPHEVHHQTLHPMSNTLIQVFILIFYFVMKINDQESWSTPAFVLTSFCIGSYVGPFSHGGRQWWDAGQAGRHSYLVPVDAVIQCRSTQLFSAGRRSYSVQVDAVI